MERGTAKWLSLFLKASSNASSNSTIFFCFSLDFYFSAKKHKKTAKPVFSRLCGLLSGLVMVEIRRLELLTS